MPVVVSTTQGGTGANSAAQARVNLGVTNFTFVNTSTITVAVTNTTTGNANISFSTTSNVSTGFAKSFLTL